MRHYIDPTRQDFAKFREMQREGPVHMLNLIRFRDTAAYDDGTVATGAEAYRRYAAVADSRLIRMAPGRPGATFGEIV